MKRLDQVIIGARLEADGLVDNIALCREEHDGDATTLIANRLTKLEPVDVRQHHVKNQKVGALAAQHIQAIDAIVGATTLIALPCHELTDEQAHALVVVNQHHLGHISRLSPCNLTVGSIIANLRPDRLRANER